MKSDLYEIHNKVCQISSELSEIKQGLNCVFNFFVDGESYNNKEDAAHDFKVYIEMLENVSDQLFE